MNIVLLVYQINYTALKYVYCFISAPFHGIIGESIEMDLEENCFSELNLLLWFSGNCHIIFVLICTNCTLMLIFLS